MLAFQVAMVAIFAGATASFACVVLERRAVGESIGGRSHCVCGEQIPMYRNLPVLTWLLQRGRAACCGAAIPRWYLGAELFTVVVATLTAVIAGLVGGMIWVWTGGLSGTGIGVLAIAIWFHRPRCCSHEE